MNLAIIGIDIETQAGLKVIAQAVVQGELGSDSPLVLREEAVVAVVQKHIEVRGLRGEIGVLPGGGYRRRRSIGIEWAGANRRTPKECRDARSRQANQRRRTRRGTPIRAARYQKIGQARKDIARGSESRPDDEVLDVVAIEAELGEVLVLHPRDGVGELQACFVVAIESAEIVAEQKQVRNVEIGLPRDSWEPVISPGPLHERGVYDIGLQLRGPRAHQGLIPQ